MRRLLAAILLVLVGLVMGSAAALDVNGGILQVFHLGVKIELPSSCDAPPSALSTESPPATPPTPESPPSEPCENVQGDGPP